MSDAGFDAYARLVESLLAGSRLRRVEPLEGGVSAATKRLDVETASGEVRRLVVRHRGSDRSDWSVTAATTEFRLLERLHALGLPVQRPVGLDVACSALSAPCVVLEFIEGRVGFDAPSAITGAREMARTLARLHDLDPDREELGFLPDQTVYFDRVLGTEPASPDESVHESKIRRALKGGLPTPARDQRRLLHADFWPGNIVQLDGRIVAVLDWEDAQLGDPRADLAKCRLELLFAHGVDAADAFTNEYRRVSGMDALSSPLWDLWGAIRLIRFAEWTSGPEQLRDWRGKFLSVVEPALKGVESAGFS